MFKARAQDVSIAPKMVYKVIHVHTEGDEWLFGGGGAYVNAVLRAMRKQVEIRSVVW